MQATDNHPKGKKSSTPAKKAAPTPQKPKKQPIPKGAYIVPESATTRIESKQGMNFAGTPSQSNRKV